MGDYGIKVVDPQSGQNVNEAVDSALLLTSKYVVIKLDTTKNQSFQNINLVFLNNPPGGGANTVVYSFAHTYNYVPSNWSLVRIATVDPSSVFHQNYFMSKGVISQYTLLDYAGFNVQADATNINFEVERFGTANIVGMALQIRMYVFAEDIGL